MAGERVVLGSPLATGAGRVISSPFQFYTTGDDHLRITSFNSLTGVRLSLQMRGVDNSGNVYATQREHVPNTDRTAKSTVVGLPPGAVMNVAIFASAATPQLGQTFVIVDLIRGLGDNAIVLGTLLQGYVTSAQRLAWPGSPIQSSLEGPGALRVIVGTTPAQGAEVNEVVPAGARWQLLSLLAVFAASANVATRDPELLILWTGGLAAGVIVPLFSVTASQTFTISWWNALGVASGTLTRQTTSLANDMPLPSGSAIQTATEGLQANDQWAGVQYTVREWLEAA